jgi:hypothetical protein
VLSAEGTLFAKATSAQRKAIWREHVLQLPLFRKVQDMVRDGGGHVGSEAVREILVRNLPGMNPEKGFDTLVDWARHGELFAYDDASRRLSLP